MLDTIRHFDQKALRETTVRAAIAPYEQPASEEAEGSYAKDPTTGRWVRRRPNGSAVATETMKGVTASGMHGRCFGPLRQERASWAAPRCILRDDNEARPGYNSCSKSEFLDQEATLKLKVRALASLIRRSTRTVVFAGAGLSTSAGIRDYASEPGERDLPGLSKLRAEIEGRYGRGDTPTAYRSPLCAQPSLGHRVLVGLHRANLLHRLIQQNHDALPQKAGMPQEALNEIHGAIHSPDNPVVPMSGELRADLFADLLECERTADLAIAVGTSLCGMNADRVVLGPAQRASQGAQGEGGALGAVVIGLQRTVVDEEATLRIFAPLDLVLGMLAIEMGLDVPRKRPEGTFFTPPALASTAEDDPERYLFRGVPYDTAGRRATDGTTTDLDLRDGARLVITTGRFGGAQGEVDGYDREGNPRCRFVVKVKKFRAPQAMLLGTWWLQAAADGTVEQLPVVNPPSEGDTSEATRLLSEAIAAAGPAGDSA